MSAISSYSNETPATGDKLIGTDATDGGTHNFTVDALKTFYSTAPTLTGIVGIGNAGDLGSANSLHIKTADSGATTLNAAADELVIESNDSAGLSIMTPNNKIGALVFGDSDANETGAIRYDHSADRMAIHAGATAMLYATASYVGIGNIPDLGSALHVKTADSGATSVSADADEIIVESNGNSGLTVLSGATSYGRLNFGDSGSNNVGEIRYFHSDNSYTIKVNGADRLVLDNIGQLYPSVTEDQNLGLITKEWNNLYVQNSPTVSDERKKKDVQPIDYGTTLLKALNPIQYVYKDTVIPAEPAVDAVLDEDGNIIAEAKEAIPEKIIPHSRPHTGFIAQEVKDAMTSIGLGDWAGYALEDCEDMDDGKLHTIRLNEFIGVLVAGFKELEERVSALESA